MPMSAASSKKQEFQKNIYFCFIDDAKTFDCVGHNKLWKISCVKDGNTRPPDLPLRNLYADQEATLRTRHGTTDCFQEYIKAVYCHPAYLTCMESTS